jgi:hypothetical protein
MNERFRSVERLADAVLYEGYVLYPYRASSAKNQVRWQFGIVAPRPPLDSEADGEPWFAETECLVERVRLDGAHASTPACLLHLRVRFLHPQRRTQPVGSDGADRSTWLEGMPGTVDIGPIDLGDLPVNREHVLDSGVGAQVQVDATDVDGFVKIRFRLESLEIWRPEYAANREEMLQHSLVSAHLLLGVEGGTFVSLLEPPTRAAAVASGCRNRHLWPVLVGDRGRRDLLLSSPIVLYDYPAVAKESPGDLCDATEIDEILSLRIMTMTAEEKREARLTDPRARAIIDSVDALSPEALASLHGTMRSADFFNPPDTPSPDTASIAVDGIEVRRGAHVRLRPRRRADTMDLFLRDQLATVAGVYRDVDDRVYVAVTVDADPAASLQESVGRFFYFDPSELEPIEQQERI